jgi:hypothetical protein
MLVSWQEQTSCLNERQARKDVADREAGMAIGYFEPNSVTGDLTVNEPLTVP